MCTTFKTFFRTRCSQSHYWLSHESEFNWEHPHDSCSVSHPFNQCTSVHFCWCLSVKRCFFRCFSSKALRFTTPRSATIWGPCPRGLRRCESMHVLSTEGWTILRPVRSLMQSSIRASEHPWFYKNDFYRFTCVILQSHYVFVNSSFPVFFSCVVSFWHLCCLQLLLQQFEVKPVQFPCTLA